MDKIEDRSFSLIDAISSINMELRELRVVRPQMDQDIVSGIKQIALELGISYHHCRSSLLNGQIPARKLGQVWLASRSALRRWVSGDVVGFFEVSKENAKRSPGRPKKNGLGGAK
ncbi:hypothetical protein [Halothiobacillus sp.]|uniref:hypothetical protein n=1 Tax=Halothiobacillus sp. TaxID=1891311 RepID=UPI002AD3E55B|nr:hypothetical protein [Halothiobacillus sp.]